MLLCQVIDITHDGNDLLLKKKSLYVGQDDNPHINIKITSNSHDWNDYPTNQRMYRHMLVEKTKTIISKTNNTTTNLNIHFTIKKPPI